MRPSRPNSPQPVLPACQPWPLFDVVTSRTIEQRALEMQAGGLLMRRAGLAVARWALAMAPHARRVWIAAGPGGNGGDGLHAAAELQRLGRSVTVSLHADAERLPADAGAGLARAREAGVEIQPNAVPPSPDLDLAIDALLGLGTHRAPEGAICHAIDAMNAMQVPRLSIDLPSGLAADTGVALGNSVVRANATLALLTLKPGLFMASGRDHVGNLWFDDLGFEPLASERPVARITHVGDWQAAVPARQHSTHKGSFGDVVVVGGAPGMVGAARLAAHAALAAGAGRTFVSLLDRGVPREDVTRPEWLWLDGAWLPGRAALEHSTVVCGCGGGGEVRQALPALLSRSARLVLDADALNAIAADPALAALLAARPARSAATVMTPHPLEAARLLGCSTAQVQADRLAAARSLAEQWRAVVVLKGSGTVIATPDALPAVNATGNAALATGGTGDVLAGWIGGLWAQQPLGHDEARESQIAMGCAAAAVWLHGRAADGHPGVAIRALDLVQAMRSARPAC